jgi:hypothetical protein
MTTFDGVHTRGTHEVPAASCGSAPLPAIKPQGGSGARPDGRAGTHPALKDGACVPPPVNTIAGRPAPAGERFARGNIC